MLQLDPPMPVVTPKGNAMAHVLIDYGPEHNLFWVCFQDATGECWTWANKDIRAQSNITLGRVVSTTAKAKPKSATKATVDKAAASKLNFEDLGL